MNLEAIVELLDLTSLGFLSSAAIAATRLPTSIEESNGLLTITLRFPNKRSCQRGLKVSLWNGRSTPRSSNTRI